MRFFCKFGADSLFFLNQIILCVVKFAFFGSTCQISKLRSKLEQNFVGTITYSEERPPLVKIYVLKSRNRKLFFGSQSTYLIFFSTYLLITLKGSENF